MKTEITNASQRTSYVGEVYTRGEEIIKKATLNEMPKK
jgi:hypothetical protein